MNIQIITVDPIEPSVNKKYTAGGLVLINCDATNAAFSVYCPTAKQSMLSMFVFKKTDSSANAITIVFQAGETGDGATTATLTTQYAVKAYVSDYTNYHKLF